MPEPITGEQRGLGETSAAVSRPERPTPDRAILDRGSRQVLSQEEPYSTRAGPLMGMKARVQRAAQLKLARQRELELDRLEKEMRTREASVVGGAAARLVHDLHQTKVKGGSQEGIGYGVEWLAKRAEKVEKEKGPRARELFVEKERNAMQGRGLTECSCLTILNATLLGYASAQGLGEPLTRAFATASDARGKGKQLVFGGRGTVLLEELRKNLGFETVHIDAVPDRKKYKHPEDYTSDADVRRTRAVPTNPNTQLVVGADSGDLIDVHVQVERFIKLDNKLERKRMSAESRDLFESLKRLEFAVGVADSGLHTFALSGGMVYEVNWGKGPKDPKLTSAKPLDDFFKQWGSAVIAVPQGALNKPKGAADIR